MPSSYTSSLRLTLPATGELSGTWGTTVNTGITELTDAAIAGYVSVVMTDADYTLTVASGATDQARRMMLNITGTLTAPRSVICPAVSKLYVIKNSTTGGVAITLKTALGAGISIPNGKTMLLMCNGTDVVDAITNFSSVTFGSPLVATSGGTGQSAYAVGDLLYASTTTALSKLADVATGNSLISGGVGVAPSWGKIGLTTHISGTLAATNGGTGQASYAVGDLIYASTTTALSKLADVATGNALISGGVGVAPSWGKIGLTTHVSGTLPTANGGTGSTTYTANGVVYASGVSTLTNGSALSFNGTALTVNSLRISLGGGSIASNIALGANSLNANTTGSQNTATGESTLFTNTGGQSNTAFGFQTQYSGLNANNNTSVGTAALQVNSAGNNNTVIGYLSGQNITGSNNTIVGCFNGNQLGLDISVASNYIVLSDGAGNPRQVIDNSGNTGFGVVAPAQKLDVLGSIQARPAATQDAILISGRAGGTGSFAATLTTATLASSVTHTLPAVTGTLATTANTTQTFSGATTFSNTLTASAAVTLSATTANIALGTSQTTGTLTLGATAQTGAITVGQSTGAQTLNLGTGATLSGSTKTINIGTNGVSGSTTLINFGSSTTNGIFESFGTHTIRPSTGGNYAVWLLGGYTATNSIAALIGPQANAGVSEITSVKSQISAVGATLNTVYHFRAQQDTWLTTTATNQYGLVVEDFSGATNNYGVYTNTASGANKWAFYANGTANSYFNGNVGFGLTGPAQKVDVIGSIQARPAATQDAVLIAGRAGGTGSWGATLTTATLAANVTHTLPAVTGTLATTANTSQTFAGATTFSNTLTASNTFTASNAVTLSATTQNIALGTSQTTGTLTLGAPAQTGTLTLDQSTKTHTLNIGTGATENTLTKTINLGTGGVNGSTHTITIGSPNASAGSTTVHGNAAFRPLTNSGSVPYLIFANGQMQGAAGPIGIWSNIEAVSSTASSITGFQSNVSSNTGTVLDSIYFFRAAYAGALGTITNTYGLYVDDFYDGTNKYGVYTATVSGANKWAFYAGGTAASFFNGNVSVGGTGSLQVTGSGGLGYGTGSGGAQTQTISRTTGVTLNKTNGAITLFSAAGTTAWQSFTVTNSTVAATDTVIVSQKSGTDLYQIFVTAVAASSFRITFATTGGTTTEQPVFNFAVIKAVTA